MKKIVSIILAVVIFASFASCGYNEVAAKTNKPEPYKSIPTPTPTFPLHTVKPISPMPTIALVMQEPKNEPENIYIGEDESIDEACSYLDDAYTCLSNAYDYINSEEYEDAKDEVEEAQREINKALQILGYYP